MPATDQDTNRVFVLTKNSLIQFDCIFQQPDGQLGSLYYHGEIPTLTVLCQPCPNYGERFDIISECAGVDFPMSSLLAGLVPTIIISKPAWLGHYLQLR